MTVVIWIIMRKDDSPNTVVEQVEQVHETVRRVIRASKHTEDDAAGESIGLWLSHALGLALAQRLEQPPEQLARLTVLRFGLERGCTGHDANDLHETARELYAALQRDERALVDTVEQAAVDVVLYDSPTAFDRLVAAVNDLSSPTAALGKPACVPIGQK